MSWTGMTSGNADGFNEYWILNTESPDRYQFLPGRYHFLPGRSQSPPDRWFVLENQMEILRVTRKPLPFSSFWPTPIATWPDYNCYLAELNSCLADVKFYLAILNSYIQVRIESQFLHPGTKWVIVNFYIRVRIEPPFLPQRTEWFLFSNSCLQVSTCRS